MLLLLLSPRFSGRETLVVEVPRYVKTDYSCDLASVYKNLGPKTRSSAMNFTVWDIYPYRSGTTGSSPPNYPEQPRPCAGFEGRQYSQGRRNLADSSSNSAPGGALNIQQIHGVNSVAESVPPSTNATTTFVSDAGVVTALESHAKGPTLSLAKKSQVPNVEDIKSFLAKPIRLYSNSFSSADTVSSFPAIFPMETFINTPLIGRKLEGFLGIRATVVLRLVVNGNRFQQGRYMLTWVPFGGEANTTKRLAFYNAHISTLRQRSQLHRVEVDINCDTEAVLVIPFSSALNWFPIKAYSGTNAGPLGAITLFPYVNLASAGGSTVANFTLYGHLEDVELFGATVPQMGKRSVTRVVKRNASEMEAKSANIGPVESVMSTMTNVSNALSTVPMFTPFAKPASWVFEALTGVAASFGWSKPTNLAPAHRMIINSAPYMGSVNNDDYSLPMTLDVKNYVEPVSLGLVPQDELDFTSIVSIPSYFVTIPWDNTQTAGTLLHRSTVYPGASVLTTGGVTHHTPLSFVASFFNFWRGSYHYKIKIVKTEFHSGRISINFNPTNTTGTTTTGSFANAPYLAREVFDIRECNEINIVVPYCAASPYLNTGFGIARSGQTATGDFEIWVEDPLVAPATVSSTISFIVEVSGGTDMEFAYPNITAQTPTYDVVPQMGDRVRNDCAVDSANLALSTHIDDIEASSKCIGERIRSFRSLLRAYSAVVPRVAETAAKFWTIESFNVPVTTTTTPSPYVSDLFGTLHGVFLYSRGGVRWLLIDQDAATAPTQTGVVLVTRSTTSGQQGLVGSSATLPSSPPNRAINGLKVLSRNVGNSPIQLTATALCMYPTRLCNLQMASSQASIATDASLASTIATGDLFIVGPTSASSTATRTYVKFRAGADDCDFSHFISIVPMTVGFGA